MILMLCLSVWILLAPMSFSFQRISQHPTIYITDAFLTDLECDYLIALAMGRLLPSPVFVDSQRKEVSNARQSRSFSVPVKWKEEFYMLKRIRTRLAASFTQLERDAEALQIQFYDQKGFYDLHYDTNAFIRRQLTVLLYLNTVVLGGETVFPLYSNNISLHQCCAASASQVVKIQPIRGRAVAFYPLDALSLHGSCPVIFGHKWIAQQWYRVRDS